ncbi:MAG TPA: serine/threonine protein kinase, partial [Planctomycetaceae bacterium]|nr:serine/threonine protein kinase [Planctomycetaceae bacterium]
LAIRPGGSGEVTASHVDWEVGKGIPKTPSVLAHDGLVYLVSDDGIALCIDAKTGENVWRNRLGGNYSASPILVGDKLYFCSEEGMTTVIRSGREFQELARNDLEEATLASPAAAVNSLFIRTGAALYRIQE